MKRLRHILFRLMLALLPVLAAVVPATAQNVVCSGVTSELSVVPVAGDTYVWELYNSSFALHECYN